MKVSASFLSSKNVPVDLGKLNDIQMQKVDKALINAFEINYIERG